MIDILVLSSLFSGLRWFFEMIQWEKKDIRTVKNSIR